MALEVGSVVATLGTRVDDSGFDRWERRVGQARRSADDDIDVELGADVDDAGFALYHRKLAEVRAAAARKEAYRAKLGADFDDRAFAAMEHQIAQSERAFARLDDRAVKALAKVREESRTTEKDTNLLSRAFNALTGAASGASGAVGGGGSGSVGGLRASLGGLGGPLRALLGPLAATIPLLIAVAGAATALASSLAAAVAGAAAVGVGIAAAAGPLAAVAGALTSRLNLIGEAYKALSVEQVKGGAQAAASAEAQRGAAERVKGAEESLADAQRTVQRAQDDLTDARFRARREVEQLSDAVTHSAFAEERASLSLREVVQRLAAVEGDPASTRLERDQAREDVKEARHAISDAAVEHKRALEDRRRGTDTVRRAEEQLAQARRAAGRASDQVASAQAAAAAATAKQGAAASDAQAKLAQLTDVERHLVTTFQSFSAAFTATMQGATDAIFSGVDGALTRLEPIMERFRGRFTAIGETIGGLVDHASRSLAGPAWTSALDAFVATAQRVIRPLGNALGSIAEIFRNVAVAALPYVREFADYIERVLGKLDRKSGNKSALGNLIKSLVDSTRDWWNLLVAVGDLLITVFGGGKAEGDNLVETLTKLVQKWDAFLETDKGQAAMKQFFRDAVQATVDLAKAIGGLVGIIFKISDAFLRVNARFQDFSYTIDAGMGLLATTIRDAFVTTFDAIIGGLTTIMGGVSSLASLLSHLPGGGKFRGIAGEIDEARASMDAFRKSTRDASDEMGRTDRIQTLATYVDALRGRLAHLGKGTDEYRDTQEKLRGKTRELSHAMIDAKEAGDKGSTGPRALGRSALNAAGAVDSANAKIVASYNAIASQLGDLKPLRYTVSKSLSGLLDEPDSLSSSPPVPGLKRASGGWIGAPGMAGQDTVHFDAPVGTAILTRHQQPAAAAALGALGLSLDDVGLGSRGGPTRRVAAGAGEFMVDPAATGVLNAALPIVGLGGLDDLFSSIRTPHYMARGGRVIGDTDYGAAMRQALNSLANAAGITINVQSGGRTMAEQAALVAQKGLYGPGNPTGAAAPSPNAPHVLGIAADITPGRERLAGLASRFGLGFPLPREPWHIQLEGAGAASAIGGTRPAAIAEQIRRVLVGGPGGRLRTIAQRTVDRVRDAANRKLAAASSAFAGITGRGSSRQIRSWLYQGLKLAGVPPTPANIDTLYGRVMQESGGDPRAVNLWDSNAKAGYPSRGLLQTIPQTFNTYKVEGHDQIDNPVDNVAAAVRYMLATYGHLVGAGPGGYATGGLVAAAARFARGGRVPGLTRSPARKATTTGTTLSLRALQSKQTDRVAAYDALLASVDSDQKLYTQADRRYNLSDEVLIDPDTGFLNEDAIKQRADELTGLMAIRQRIEEKLEKARQIALRVVKAYTTIIGRFRASLKHAKKKDRAGILDSIETAQSNRAEWMGKATDTAFDVEDARLDILELGKERAEVLGTQPDDRTDTATADTGEPATRPPTAADIAAAARQQFNTFTTAREDLFRTFGSNTIEAGANPYAGITAQAAGAAHFGATGGIIAPDARAYAAPGGSAIFVEKAEFHANYPATPPDGGSYIQQQQREAALAFG